MSEHTAEKGLRENPGSGSVECSDKARAAGVVDQSNFLLALAGDAALMDRVNEGRWTYSPSDTLKTLAALLSETRPLSPEEVGDPS